MLYNLICKCGNEFVGTGPAAKYCFTCGIKAKEIQKQKSRERSKAYKIKHNLVANPDSGSGSATGKGTANHMYKHGKYVFETLRNEIKAEIRYCERCNKDLLNATQHQWNVHHKDHDHWNHERSNLELLCKRCHQIEHECWKHFTKV